jgi:hypothetical protein
MRERVGGDAFFRGTSREDTHFATYRMSVKIKSALLMIEMVCQFRTVVVHFKCSVTATLATSDRAALHLKARENQPLGGSTNRRWWRSAP